ncbi:MAG: HAMP domain-containing protein [Clostridia bacterium]|nr:HAMP domain-containing protein [Clostridia bacterium]NLS85137.1 histidine kinase [Oscillospiraceae bacterium]
MLQKLKAIVNNLPLKHKIIAIVVLVDFVMFGICSVFGLNIVIKQNNELLYENIAKSLTFSASQLKTVLTEEQRILTSLAADSTLQSSLALVNSAGGGDAVVRSVAFRNLGNTVQSYYAQFVSGDVDFVSIYSKSMTVHSNTARAQQMTGAFVQRLKKEAVAADGRPVWINDAETGELYVTCLVRQISPFTLDTLGVVVARVNTTSVVRRCVDYGGFFERSCYALSMPNDDPLYVSPTLPNGIDAADMFAANDSYRLLTTGEHRYFCVTGTVPVFGWKYATIVSYDSMFAAKRASVLTYTAVLIAGVLLSILLCGLLINQITRHIDKLIQKMQAFGENEATLAPVSGDYSARLDEIGVLHRKFDKMANKIVALIQTDYTNQILMKDAQLKALEAQIDPHFLYNVLASVNWRAKAIGATKISMMVEALSHLLRATLTNSADAFTLKDELSLVSDYATIQQCRFEDRLTFSMEVPSELLDAEIPKLTVQPLVENAIRYALQEDDEACDVSITAARSAELLILSVSNTGSQFPPNILKSLEAGEIQTHGFGIGILNIQKRLRMTFGEPYGLDFYNTAERAVAQISIPYKPIELKQ